MPSEMKENTGKMMILKPKCGDATGGSGEISVY